MKFVDGYPYNVSGGLAPADDSVLRSGGQTHKFPPGPRIVTKSPSNPIAVAASIVDAFAALDSLLAENRTLRHENDCLKDECTELHGLLNSIRAERDTANAKTFGRMP